MLRGDHQNSSNNNPSDSTLADSPINDNFHLSEREIETFILSSIKNKELNLSGTNLIGEIALFFADAIQSSFIRGQNPVFESLNLSSVNVDVKGFMHLIDTIINCCLVSKQNILSTNNVIDKHGITSNYDNKNDLYTENESEYSPQFKADKSIYSPKNYSKSRNMQQSPSLNKLILSSNDFSFSPEYGNCISRLVRECRGSLNELILTDCKLGTSGLHAMLTSTFALSELKFGLELSLYSVSVLDLSGNALGDMGLLTLCKGFASLYKRRCMVRLRVLRLHRNAVTNHGAQCLAQQLLIMSASHHNNDLDKMANVNSNSQRQNMTGIHFGLTPSPQRHQPLQKGITQSAFTNCILLQELGLDDNPGISLPGLHSLLSLLPQYSSLQIISLARCKPSFAALELLAVHLSHPCTALRVIDLKFTDNTATETVHEVRRMKSAGTAYLNRPWTNTMSRLVDAVKAQLLRNLPDQLPSTASGSLRVYLGSLPSTLFDIITAGSANSSGDDEEKQDMTTALDLMHSVGEVLLLPINVKRWVLNNHLVEDYKPFDIASSVVSPPSCLLSPRTLDSQQHVVSNLQRRLSPSDISADSHLEYGINYDQNESRDSVITTALNKPSNSKRIFDVDSVSEKLIDIDNFRSERDANYSHTFNDIRSHECQLQDMCDSPDSAYLHHLLTATPSTGASPRYPQFPQISSEQRLYSYVPSPTVTEIAHSRGLSQLPTEVSVVNNQHEILARVRPAIVSEDSDSSDSNSALTSDPISPFPNKQVQLPIPISSKSRRHRYDNSQSDQTARKLELSTFTQSFPSAPTPLQRTLESADEDYFDKRVQELVQLKADKSDKIRKLTEAAETLLTAASPSLNSKKPTSTTVSDNCTSSSESVSVSSSRNNTPAVNNTNLSIPTVMGEDELYWQRLIRDTVSSEVKVSLMPLLQLASPAISQFTRNTSQPTPDTHYSIPSPQYQSSDRQARAASSSTVLSGILPADEDEERLQQALDQLELLQQHIQHLEWQAQRHGITSIPISSSRTYSIPAPPPNTPAHSIRSNKSEDWKVKPVFPIYSKAVYSDVIPTLSSIAEDSSSKSGSENMNSPDPPRSTVESREKSTIIRDVIDQIEYQLKSLLINSHSQSAPPVSIQLASQPSPQATASHPKHHAAPMGQYISSLTSPVATSSHVSPSISPDSLLERLNLLESTFRADHQSTITVLHQLLQRTVAKSKTDHNNGVYSTVSIPVNSSASKSLSVKSTLSAQAAEDLSTQPAAVAANRRTIAANHRVGAAHGLKTTASSKTRERSYQRPLPPLPVSLQPAVSQRTDRVQQAVKLDVNKKSQLQLRNDFLLRNSPY